MVDFYKALARNEAHLITRLQFPELDLVESRMNYSVEDIVEPMMKMHPNCEKPLVEPMMRMHPNRNKPLVEPVMKMHPTSD